MMKRIRESSNDVITGRLILLENMITVLSYFFSVLHAFIGIRLKRIYLHREK